MFLTGFILGAVAVVVIADLLEELTMSHYEVSPREKEDEQRRDERDFGTAELQREDEEGARHLQSDMGQPEGWLNDA